MGGRVFNQHQTPVALYSNLTLVAGSTVILSINR